jgi:hypothetical protein
VEGKDCFFDLMLGVGNSNKQFRFTVISNSPLTREEYEKWTRKQREANEKVLTKAMVDKKLAEAKACENYVYSDDQVQKVRRRKKGRKKVLRPFFCVKVIDKRQANLKRLPLKVLRQKKADVLGQLAVLRDSQTVDNTNQVEETTLRDYLLEIEGLIEEKAGEVEKISSVVGLSFNERVREAMFKTSLDNGEEYYKV